MPMFYLEFITLLSGHLVGMEQQYDTLCHLPQRKNTIYIALNPKEPFQMKGKKCSYLYT